MILGTAGHIDHGKTALVRALTGVDTDRLPEEKRRGITIDLGFAPLTLPDGTRLGVVDVPGHEAFVRTMLAGATGIDVALLIIAADEGPMPQTREHLAILELLGVPGLIVALTKSDLVDTDWTALVAEDVRELLADTPWPQAPVIATSAVARTGIAELLDAVQKAVAGAAARRGKIARNDLFRLPVDRAFTVRGTGTVVTGTVWTGMLSLEETVRVLPGGATARPRGLQNHGETVNRITPGMRAAIALAGVEPTDVARGSTLVTDLAWHDALVLRADLTLLPDAPELRPRTRVRLHIGTADVGARVVAAGGPVRPGSERPVRIVADEPVVARGGDRFVIRSASPLATIGGGVVTDGAAPRRAKPMSRTGMAAAERVALIVTESGAHGIASAAIPSRIGLAPDTVGAVAAGTKVLERVGDRWYASEVLREAAERIVALVEAHHTAHPLEPGLPRQDARSRLRLDQGLFDRLLRGLADAKRLDVSGAELRAHGRAPVLSDTQGKAAAEIVAVLEAAGAEPPSVGELQERFGPQAASLLRLLEREKRVVQVEETRYYAPAAFAVLLQTLESGMAGKGELAPTEIREMLGVSRKFLIPLLEYCDKRGYTQRQGNGRIWRGRAQRPSGQPPAFS